MQVKKSHNMYMFKLLEPEDNTPVSTASFVEAVEMRLFNEITVDTAIDFNHGFTSAVDMGHFCLAGDVHHPVFGNKVFVGYRFDRKRVSANAVTVEYNKRLTKLREEILASVTDGAKAPKITKEQRKELKNRVLISMLGKALFAPKQCGVMYDADQGLLLISGASYSEAECIVAAIASAMGIPPAQVETMSILDYAFEYDPRSLTPAVRTKFDAAVAAVGGPMVPNSMAEYITFLWFLSETVTQEPQFETPEGDATVTLSGHKVVVGKLDIKGALQQSLSSDENSHGHIRYKMWHENVPAVSGSFIYALTEFTGVIGVSATNPYQLGVSVPSFFVNTENMKAIKDGNDAADFEASMLLYLDSIFGTLRVAACIARLYILARASEARWAESGRRVREWLEAYVPECERIESMLAKANEVNNTAETPTA